MRAIATASIGALAVALSSCHAPVNSKTPASRGSTTAGDLLARDAASLQPDASPGEQAVLRLGAEKGPIKPAVFEVGVRATRSGPELTLTLQAQGETIERERYDANDERFRVLEAADNTFAPPIELLHYPTHEGSESAWRGKVVYAGISRPAQATVEVQKDGADLKISAQLTIEVDPGKSAIKQELDFWIRPGKGVIRRAFGDTSIRLPVGEKWPP